MIEKENVAGITLLGNIKEVDVLRFDQIVFVS